MVFSSVPLWRKVKNQRKENQAEQCWAEAAGGAQLRPPWCKVKNQNSAPLSHQRSNRALLGRGCRWCAAPSPSGARSKIKEGKSSRGLLGRGCRWCAAPSPLPARLPGDPERSRFLHGDPVPRYPQNSPVDAGRNHAPVERSAVPVQNKLIRRNILGYRVE